MWLIDENLHKNLHISLEKFGIKAQTVKYAGLAGYDNGKLTKKAATLGFTCILTQDKDFPKDAEKALRETPCMAVVVINIPQHPPKLFISRFEDLWNRNPIVPQTGKVAHWPLTKITSSSSNSP
jgi:predicted nuclease of predicted toxin-antitoxin system